MDINRTVFSEYGSGSMTTVTRDINKQVDVFLGSYFGHVALATM